MIPAAVIAATVSAKRTPVARPRYREAKTWEITGSTLRAMINPTASRVAIVVCRTSIQISPGVAVRWVPAPAATHGTPCHARRATGLVVPARRHAGYRDRVRRMPRPSLKDAFVLAVVLVAGWHLTAVTLASLPPNRYSAAAQPATAHLAPYFTQNWRLFAPNPVSSDRSVLVQGAWLDGETVRTTAWVDWTDVELDLVRQRIVGGRAGYVTNKMHTPLVSRFADLDIDQREVADVTDPGAAPRWSTLRTELRAGSDDDLDDVQVDTYLRYDRAATRLAGSVVAVRWPGREWVAVRYAVRSQTVTPYPARRGTAQERADARPTPVQRVNGWRTPLRTGMDERESIAEFDRRHR